MGRQMLKGLAMLALLLTLALATAVATANGQSKQKLTANIPFDFIVGDKTMAAGQYRVDSVSIGGDALAIQSADSRNNAIRLTITSAPRQNTPAMLVFHRYGSTYFLSEVWRGGDAVGRQLVKSQQERAIERELSRVAHNRTTRSEEVVILASAR